MFFTLFTKLIPLYAIIALGFIAGRVWKVPPRDIANLVIYLVLPLFFFARVSETHLQPDYALLIILIITLYASAGFIALWIARRFFHSSEGNLAAYMTVTANTGYFGIPLFLALYSENQLGVYVLANISFVLLEVTTSYYIIARGNFSVRDSFRKILGLPALWAVILGIPFSVMGWHLPTTLQPLWQDLQGTYVILGMMIIGLALAQLKHFEIDWKVLGFVFSGKVILLCLVFTLIYFDQTVTHYFNPLSYHILTVIALVPTGANSVAYAAQLGVHPDKAATVVFISTVLALFYIPLAYSFIK